MKTGFQVSSLKPLLLTQAQVDAAFATIAALGVDTVQLQWIDPAVPIGDIAASLKRQGLRSVSVQDLSQTIFDNRAYYYELNGATGGIWLCPSRIPARYRSRAGLEEFAQALEQMRDELAALGQQLCFHPVAADFEKIDGICPVDFLMERLKWLDLCYDLYHVHRAGLDIPATIRKYPGRVCMVHFKEGRRLPDGSEVLVPAGQGDIDWTGTVAACTETGVPYAFVEQERWDRDPYECLKEALEWVKGQL